MSSRRAIVIDESRIKSMIRASLLTQVSGSYLNVFEFSNNVRFVPKHIFSKYVKW